MNILLFMLDMEYGIFGEGSKTSINQKRENSTFSHLIGKNLRPLPENAVHYKQT